MLHPFLTDSENAKAYLALCDHPRGSTRAWAAKAGWTHSRMRSFLQNLTRLELAKVEKLPHGSLFVPVSTCAKSCEDVSTCATPYLASSAVQAVKADKLPRYGEAPGSVENLPADEAEQIRLVVELNAALTAKFDGAYTEILLDNWGSLQAAKKILKLVPVDRAVTLVREAAFAFTPDKTGGELPHSLGHPFLCKYVMNEWRRIKRDLERGQLPFLFVEQSAPRTVYGSRAAVAPPAEAEKPKPPALAGEKEIEQGRAEMLSLASSPLKPGLRI